MAYMEICEVCNTRFPEKDMGMLTIGDIQVFMCVSCTVNYQNIQSNDAVRKQRGIKYFKNLPEKNRTQSKRYGFILKAIAQNAPGNIRTLMQVELEEARNERIERTKNPKPVQCPRCGSTQIATGARGYSFWTGFLGSDKTVNRCAECGCTWEPTYRR